MPRPIYETNRNKRIENRIAEKLGEHWNCQIVKLKAAYAEIDRAAIRDEEIGAFVEIKRRYVDRETYPDIILSLSKVKEAFVLESCSGKPCYFVVQFNDCLAWAKMVVKGRTVRMAGRFDRDDPQDVEPCVAIPIDEFKVILDEPSDVDDEELDEV